MDIPVYRKGEAPVRAYCIERKTKETCVSVDLCLDAVSYTHLDVYKRQPQCPSNL